MGEKQEAKGIKRRTFLKTMVGAAALGFGVSVLPATSRRAYPAVGGGIGDFGGCRLVVFGADGLRFDTAQDMWNQGAPALSSLNPPILSVNGGLSVTQPGWATIWMGLPSYYTGAIDNSTYSAPLEFMHIMRKLMWKYRDEDHYSVWITGKGGNIKGNSSDAPHRELYYYLKMRKSYPGFYDADIGHSNDEVYALAQVALAEAVTHRNFTCFVHFVDPDHTGHIKANYADYLDAALEEVDQYISLLMQLLPPDVDIIYCSDHGFNFKELGEIETGHRYAPWGMLATNFQTNNFECVPQDSIGRLIYARGGGNPDYTGAYDRGAGITRAYRMYGIDLV